MKSNINNLVSRINRRKFTNNIQRVLFQLLKTPGEWVSRSSIRVPSATSRIRDLRKETYGGFQVECATATELGRRGSVNTTYYRLVPKTITAQRVMKVLGDTLT